MNTFVLPSTFFLTVLITIGLFFFIRASVKTRIETATWTLPQPDRQVVESVTQYLEGRAYRLKSVDRDRNQVVFAGLVGASTGLALFLSALAAVGAVCFGLVLSVQFPSVGYWGVLTVVLAPLAGWFYQKKSTRPEQVVLSVKGSDATDRTRLRITAHRDEIASLETALGFPPQEE
ncbi:cofactor assembly of complex C subunit B [Altericista sp. CCNU0014]|uniref:cofactor assembly of complex C subunit B n=1 Tax=Altericista sp. CCNU0014 TaxID=3082949 RepID=UPI00384C8918